MDSPTAFAAMLAPVIDRVHAAVHRASRGAVPDPPAHVGGLIDLRFALLARPRSRAGLAAVYRYAEPGWLDREIAAHQEQGTLAADDSGALVPTPAGRAFLTGLLAVHAAVTGTLWAARADTVADLAGITGRLVEVAAGTGGPAYAVMAPPYEPPGAPAGLLLFNRLAAARYHRADAHAAAWRAAGLDAAGIRSLPPGPRRAAIEDATNRRAGEPYAALTPDERSRLLAGLTRLDG